MDQDDDRPRMPLHLQSRYSPIAELTAALFWAIEETGPRLPPRRDIARLARMSEATVSRRFRDRRTTEDALVARLAAARMATFPPGWVADGWDRWVPRTERDLTDARVWLTCLGFAAYSATAAESVRETWELERTRLAQELAPATRPQGDGAQRLLADLAAEADAVHALLLGLTVLRVVDPGMTQERALAALDRVVGRSGQAPATETHEAP